MIKVKHPVDSSSQPEQSETGQQMQTTAIALWLVSLIQWQSSSFGEPPAETFWMLVVTPRDRQSVPLLTVYGTDISSRRAETGEPFGQAMHSSSFIQTARSSDFGQLLLGSGFGDVLQFKVENLHFVCLFLLQPEQYVYQKLLIYLLVPRYPFTLLRINI